MRANYGNELAIEDIGSHPAEVLRGLRACLAAKSQLVPDPKRTSLFEVQGCSSVYYVHVSPISGKISLLATWPSEPANDKSNRAA